MSFFGKNEWKPSKYSQEEWDKFPLCEENLSGTDCPCGNRCVPYQQDCLHEECKNLQRNICSQHRKMHCNNIVRVEVMRRQQQEFQSAEDLEYRDFIQKANDAWNNLPTCTAIVPYSEGIICGDKCVPRSCGCSNVCSIHKCECEIERCDMMLKHGNSIERFGRRMKRRVL